MNKPIVMTVENLFVNLGLNLKPIGYIIQNVYFGYSVELGGGFVIHRYSRDSLSIIKVTPDVASTTLTNLLKCLAGGKEAGGFNAIISSGCCGWFAGQLEKEMTVGDWLILLVEEDFIFRVPIEERHYAILSLLGIAAEQTAINIGNA